MTPLAAGSIRLHGVSRRFRVVHDRNATLKETILRRKRTTYSELWALRDVDLRIDPGESVAIVGRNGSGKSTLLKVLAGIIPPHAGNVVTSGSVASMLELGAGFHPDFTGRENVFMNAAIHGLSQREVTGRLPAIVDFAELQDFIDMPVRTYSSGMQMRLAFAVASHVNPDILLLDEVLAVGDEAFQRKCMGRIADFKAGGGTLVFVSHDPNAVETVCNRAILVDNGRVTEDGNPHDVMNAYHRALSDSPGRIGVEVEVIEQVARSPEEPASGRLGWGTGKADITLVEVLDGKGRPATRFVAGDPISFVVHVAPHEDLDDPSIGITVSAAEGTLCFGTNTRREGIPVPPIREPTTVRFTLEALPLNEGAFSVTAAVHTRDEREVFHWIDQVAAFDVFARGSGVGVVDTPSGWGVTMDASVVSGADA